MCNYYGVTKDADRILDEVGALVRKLSRDERSERVDLLRRLRDALGD